MADLNNFAIVGRLTRDAELRYTKSGTPCAGFSIASNRYAKNADGNQEVSYFDCVVWGSMAEKLMQYLTKGKQIGATGELRQNRWQDNNGQNRNKVVLNIGSLQLLGGEGKGNRNQQENRSAQAGDGGGYNNPPQQHQQGGYGNPQGNGGGFHGQSQQGFHPSDNQGWEDEGDIPF